MGSPIPARTVVAQMLRDGSGAVHIGYITHNAYARLVGELRNRLQRALATFRPADLTHDEGCLLILERCGLLTADSERMALHQSWLDGVLHPAGNGADDLPLQFLMQLAMALDLELTAELRPFDETDRAKRIQRAIAALES